MRQVGVSRPFYASGFGLELFNVYSHLGAGDGGSRLVRYNEGGAGGLAFLEHPVLLVKPSKTVAPEVGCGRAVCYGFAALVSYRTLDSKPPVVDRQICKRKLCLEVAVIVQFAFCLENGLDLGPGFSGFFFIAFLNDVELKIARKRVPGPKFLRLNRGCHTEVRASVWPPGMQFGLSGNGYAFARAEDLPVQLG